MSGAFAQAELLALVMARGAGEEGQFAGPFVLWMVRCVNAYCFDNMPGNVRGQPIGLEKAWQQELEGNCLHPTLGNRERRMSLSTPFSVY